MKGTNIKYITNVLTYQINISNDLSNILITQISSIPSLAFLFPREARRELRSFVSWR